MDADAAWSLWLPSSSNARYVPQISHAFSTNRSKKLLTALMISSHPIFVSAGTGVCLGQVNFVPHLNIFFGEEHL